MSVETWGGNELAKKLEGRRVQAVGLEGGWIGLDLDDGSFLHISAENGQSLSLSFESKNTDPRKLGGSISGPGGPYDEDAVVIDTTNAVLLEAVEVAIVGAVRKGVLDKKPLSALVMRGRINKTPTQAQVLFLTNEDGAAGLVTQLIGLASRAGWGREFLDRVQARMDEMPT